MKNINKFLLLLFGLLLAGQTWAEEWVVTNISTDAAQEGSLPYIISNLSEGENIITFDQSLSNQVIDFAESDFAESGISIGNDISITGNGITIQNIGFMLYGTTTFTNLKLKSSSVFLCEGKQFSFINCIFKGCYQEGLMTLTNWSEASNINVEGCFFISENSPANIDFSTLPEKAYFTSCSFYNTASESTLFYTGNTNNNVPIVLTNCAIIDSNETISDCPITSGGYNVIKGSFYDGTAPEATDITGTEIEVPFIIAIDIPKVKSISSAALHLPADVSFTDQDIHLPLKDIEGNQIDYTKATHSGACQRMDTEEATITGISLAPTTVKFILSKNETEQELTVIPTPQDAQINETKLSWNSSNEDVATIENGVVKAKAAGQATITVTYDGTLTSTCNVEVLEYITVTSKEASGEGSLEAILLSLQDGDIITFSDNLTGQSIQLPTSTDPQKPKNVINKSITIKGNKVILTGGYLTIDKNCMDKVCIENLNFKNSGIYATDYTRPLSLKNCTFDGGFTHGGTISAISTPATSSLTAEKCFFISGDNQASATYILWDTKGKSLLSFTSCSFINTTKESISPHLEGNIIHVNYWGHTPNKDKNFPEITLTNCVMMDNPPRQTGSTSPAIIAPVIHSGGNNVIKGLLSIDKTNALTADKGDVVSASMPNPVIAENGEYKVVEGRSGFDKVAEGIHSGAIQTTTKATEIANSIKLFSPATILNLGKTLDIEATVYPENAAVEAFEWESSNAKVATVDNGIVTPVSVGNVVITAILGDIRSTTVNLTINGATVEKIELNKDKAKLFIHYPEQLKATVLPEMAINKELDWSSSDPSIATVDESGKVTPIKEGQTTITVTAQSDKSITATCEVTVNKTDYTNGVFIVNEDWYTHFNGTVNYLTPEGDWLYRVVQHENPGRELGATTQFGTIYGDKFYLVSKQEKDPGTQITGSRFAVCDPKTMKIEREFEKIEFEGTSGDGRSFLGVDEKTGYVSTSNGIYIFDLKTNAFTGRVTGTEGDDQGSGNPGSNPGLYTGQIGTMCRVGDRIFAIHQKEGLLVINASTHKIEKVMGEYKYTTLQQSKDGYLWAGTTSDNTGGLSNASDKRLLKIDPWTLTITEIPIDVPGPYATWGAWHADAFCGSAKENKLYWKAAPSFEGKIIYEYDIDQNKISEFFNIKNYETGEWRIYETGFRIDPETNDFYIMLNKGVNTNGQYNRTIILKPSTRKITTHTMEDYYWFPAMPVFPDNEAPVVNGLEQANVSLTGKRQTILFTVTDADNMDAAIVKSVTNSNPDLIDASIIKEGIQIILLKSVTETESSDLTFKFNSNGKIVEKTITVNATNITLIEATGITISQQSATLTIGESVQLTAVISPDNASDKEIAWKSSNESIVSVTSDGLIKALKAGTATITVKSVSDDLKAECVVNVNAPVITPPEVVFALNKQSLTLSVNQMEQLTANAESGQSVEWSTSDASVATINNGQVIARKAGGATITAQNKTTGKSATCQVTVQETEILPDVDVEETAAYIIFPRLKEADYYVVSVYKRTNGLQTLAFTLKVGADGSILRSTRSSDGDINIYLPNLEMATEYITIIEAMREIAGGKSEVIKVISSPSFTTGTPTSNESLSAQKPAVYYRKNALLLKGMEGYTCYIVTLNGQIKELFEVNSTEDIHQTNLSAGVYLLTGTKGEKMVTFKFIAK